MAFNLLPHTIVAPHISDGNTSLVATELQN